MGTIRQIVPQPSKHTQIVRTDFSGECIQTWAHIHVTCSTLEVSAIDWECVYASTFRASPGEGQVIYTNTRMILKFPLHEETHFRLFLGCYHEAISVWLRASCRVRVRTLRQWSVNDNSKDSQINTSDRGDSINVANLQHCVPCEFSHFLHHMTM